MGARCPQRQEGPVPGDPGGADSGGGRVEKGFGGMRTLYQRAGTGGRIQRGNRRDGGGLKKSGGRSFSLPQPRNNQLVDPDLVWADGWELENQ